MVQNIRFHYCNCNIVISKSMFSKLKHTLTNITEQEKEPQQIKKIIDVSILNSEELNLYKKIFSQFKQNIEELDQIAKSNLDGLKQYIKQKQKQAAAKQAVKTAGGEPADQNQAQKYSFDEDMKQIKQILAEVDAELKQLIAFDQQIVAKVSQMNQSNGNPLANKNTQQLLAKYEHQIASLKKSQQNNKEILNTLGQQSQLYAKQMRQLQQKSLKLQKELNAANVIISNLREEKIVLLQMRNSSATGQLPQVQALKIKLAQFEKRVNLERSKVQAKQKEIQGLRKKLQEDHESLEKIADQLKQKQLKSKKIIDKYERSKTEIRKFREQKTQFIKQLNIQVAKMSQQLAQQRKKNDGLRQQVEKLKEQIQNLKTEVSKNQNRKIELQSSKSQLMQIRKQLHNKNMEYQQKSEQLIKMKEANDQLHQKRKQLLQALEKPINHEIRTLQKILKALDKLYKEYITTVFQDGNIVGFQTRITYIISNVQEIKEDLLL